MAYNKLPKLPTWAEDVTLQPLDLTQPTDPQIKDGFVRTPTPPKRPWFNWFFNRIMSGLQYLTRRGIADWDANEEYLVGDKTVSTVDGKVYQAKDVSIGNEPSASPLKWERWGFTLLEGDTRYAALYGDATLRFNVADAEDTDEATTLQQLNSGLTDLRYDLTPLVVHGLSTAGSATASVGYRYEPATGYTEMWGFIDTGGNASTLYPLTLDVVFHASLSVIYNSTVSNGGAATVQFKTIPNGVGLSIVSSVEAESDDVFHPNSTAQIMWKVTGKRNTPP